MACFSLISNFVALLSNVTQSENIALCTLCVFAQIHIYATCPFLHEILSSSSLSPSLLSSSLTSYLTLSPVLPAHFSISHTSIPPTKEAWCDGDCLSFTQGELVWAKLAGDLAGGETVNDQWNRCKEDKIKAYPMMCHTGEYMPW